VTSVGAEGRPARGFDVGRRRWPRRLGEKRRGSAVLGNKQAWEVHGCLGERPTQLFDGEHERGGELQAAAAIAAVRLRVARGGGNDRLL
jgi:hypothetical protein